MALLDLNLSRPHANAAPVRRSILDIARNMAALRRQRLALKRLDDAALKDIGLTRQQAVTEAGRAPWDAPETWR